MVGLIPAVKAKQDELNTHFQPIPGLLGARTELKLSLPFAVLADDCGWPQSQTAWPY